MIIKRGIKMNKIQRARYLLSAAVMFVCAAVIISIPYFGFVISAFILGGILVITGIRYLVYFFTMARYMVGGMSMLYRGILIIDVGAFAFSMIDKANVFILLYMLWFYGTAGFFSIVRGRNAKKSGSPIWRLSIINGIVNLLFVLASLIFIRSKIF